MGRDKERDKWGEIKQERSGLRERKRKVGWDKKKRKKKKNRLRERKRKKSKKETGAVMCNLLTDVVIPIIRRSV